MRRLLIPLITLRSVCLHTGGEEVGLSNRTTLISLRADGSKTRLACRLERTVTDVPEVSCRSNLQTRPSAAFAIRTRGRMTRSPTISPFPVQPSEIRIHSQALVHPDSRAHALRQAVPIVGNPRPVWRVVGSREAHRAGCSTGEASMRIGSRELPLRRTANGCGEGVYASDGKT